ncbi:SusC/RagA family TonB-linked outer membrane protein, partial [Arachidicoccus sp.]|uniref:SusC/RagA family TonB-linked outer membrane protein n=1 Tax=Arachidicoccus sp. TaxID=1872624 RepID=UPI003D1F602F
MKLTVFIYFITCLQLSAKGIAQTVTLSQHDISLQKLFREIKKQTGYQFFYKDELLSNAKKINQIDVQNASIKDVLDKSFKDQPFSYEIIEKTITIRPKIVTKTYHAPPPPPPVQNIIHGTITDTTGKPIAGASVTISGFKKGAITNADGTYRLEAKKGDVIQISFIGYKTKEVTVKDNDEINVQLIVEITELNNLVIVGYGKQKKIDLTGAVATVSSKELENRPVTNVSSALAGLIPGAYIYQSKGTPGEDGASIQIRGVGSLSSTSPLVVIDGIIGSLDDVNPNDVESISILKDAASVAIYGAQGAAGVILVTTKGGKAGEPTVTYTGLVSSTNPTGIPDFVTNSAQYMQTLNEAYTNIGKSVVFDSATVIQPFIDASKNPNGLTSLGVPNYVAYPNTNWEKVLFQHHLLQSHNISVSGGDKNTHYLLSLGYLNNPGLVANSGYSKYQFRINVESKIGKNITVGTQTFAKLGYSGLFDESNLFNYLVQTSPMIYPLYKGMYGSTSADGDVIGQASDLLYYTTSNKGTIPETYINTTWYAKVNILKGLTFEPKFNYQSDLNEYNYHNDPVATARYNFITLTQVTAPTPTTNLSTYSGYSKNWNYTLESALRYNTTIGGVHNIGALVVFNQYYDQNYNLAVTGYGLIDPSISAISSASSFPSNPSGSASDWATRSIIGRITYNYKDRYLFEANIRRDASSRFGPDYRYGNFPSLSAGWNISQEPFLKNLSAHNIQNIKIRASWGKAGNANIGNYRWQANYGTTPYAFNGTAYSGLNLTSIANPQLHWETTNQVDAGLDITAFHNLDLTFDWYRKYTYGILFTAPLDPTVGTASAPEGNFAQVLDNGLEFSAGWHDKVGDFSYSVNGNLTYYYYNDVKQYKGPLVAGLTTDGNGNSVYNSNIGAISSGGSQRILEG